MYETYWDVLGHFYICGETSTWRNNGPTPLNWAIYLFPSLEDGDIEELAPTFKSLAQARADDFINDATYILESPKDDFAPGTIFKSFHHQAKRKMSDRAVLTGFPMLWLKTCVTPSRDSISLSMILLAVRLACGEWVAFLQALIANIQSGIRKVIQAFVALPGVNPRVELA